MYIIYKKKQTYADMSSTEKIRGVIIEQSLKLRHNAKVGKRTSAG